MQSLQCTASACHESFDANFRPAQERARFIDWSTETVSNAFGSVSPILETRAAPSTLRDIDTKTELCSEGGCRRINRGFVVRAVLQQMRSSKRMRNPDLYTQLLFTRPVVKGHWINSCNMWELNLAKLYHELRMDMAEFPFVTSSLCS